MRVWNECKCDKIGERVVASPGTDDAQLTQRYHIMYARHLSG